MDSCKCGGKHNALKRNLAWSLDIEYENAYAEVQRLSQLFKDVCWYNFEVSCFKWKWPWHQSYLASPVLLEGIHFTHHVKRGKTHELCEFPVYFSGAIVDAPLCPVRVIQLELEEARAYLARAAANINAPYDWAPGGSKYAELQAQTLVGK